VNKRVGLALAGLVTGVVMVGGTAFAASSSIPDKTGIIHACYDGGGNLKVIDTAVTSSCPKGYSSLNWNYQGEAGRRATLVRRARQERRDRMATPARLGRKDWQDRKGHREYRARSAIRAQRAPRVLLLRVQPAST